MKETFIMVIATVFFLTACAGPNATASGSNSGARIGTDLFKIDFP